MKIHSMTTAAATVVVLVTGGWGGAMLEAAEGTHLWQELKGTVLNPGPRRTSLRISSKDTQRATAKELEPVRDLFRPQTTLTKKSGETVKYYAYPFTGLEKAHEVLDPAVIPAVLKGGRPTQLDPIAAMDGKKLDPEKLLAYLKSVRVTEKGTALELSDGDFRFMIPIQQIKLANGNNAWRLGQCEMVEAIIKQISLKRIPTGETGEDGKKLMP